MNEMILVTNENGKAMTTSLKIAEVFGKEHKDVLRKIKNEIESFNERNFTLVDYIDSKGESRPMYLLDRDFATYIIMGFSGGKAKEFKLKYIQAFNEMEEFIKNNLVKPDSYMIEDKVERAKRWIEEQQKMIALEKELIEAKPKAEYCDKVLDSDSLITTTIVAKDYGLSAVALNRILAENKIIFKQSNQWVAYAKYSKLGYASSCTYTYTDDNTGTTHSKTALKWTEKGRKFIGELLVKLGYTPITAR